MLEARPNDPYNLGIDNIGATDIEAPVIDPSNINIDHEDDEAPVIDPSNINIDHEDDEAP